MATTNCLRKSAVSNDKTNSFTRRLCFFSTDLQKRNAAVSHSVRNGALYTMLESLLALTPKLDTSRHSHNRWSWWWDHVQWQWEECKWGCDLRRPDGGKCCPGHKLDSHDGWPQKYLSHNAGWITSQPAITWKQTTTHMNQPHPHVSKASVRAQTNQDATHILS